MRRAITAALLVSAITLVTASPALADHDIIIPADENGCGFDLHVQATHLPDVARAPIGSGDITFTNLETGATYLQHSRYTDTETVDPVTGNVHGKIVGRIWFELYPGDQGPAGLVQEPGLDLLFSGTLEFTLDPETNVITAFSLNGTYKDLCALLTD
jgi:hypothetical protein